MPQMIKAEELLNQQYKWIDEQDSLGKALSCFDESCDILLVKNKDQKYSGILTERMILQSSLDRAKTKVKALKRFAPKIEPKTPVPTIAGLMIENNILHIPVFRDEQIEGIMSSPVITSSVFASIQEVINKMIQLRISGLPIMNYSDSLEGIITKKVILSPLFFIGEEYRYPLIQFSSKLHGEYQDELRILVEQFAERQKQRLSHATFVIFLQVHKPEKQNLRLISLRVRLFSDFWRFAVSAEGWGPHNAMKQALQLLEQQIYRKITEKRSIARVYKQRTWTNQDIEDLT